MLRFLALCAFYSCMEAHKDSEAEIRMVDIVDSSVRNNLNRLHSSGCQIIASHDVHMGRYFEMMDSICSDIKSTCGMVVSDYHLIHTNRWLLDSLQAQDYYTALSKGVRIENQRVLIAIHKGDVIRVPNQAEVDSIDQFLSSTVIDVNIPEFTMRIWAGDSLIYRCIVRVGKNERKYLALAGHEVNLRTPIGEGHIVRIERNPIYINPVDGHRYKTTRRDDGNYTQLPRIPFLEPEINGIRSGALMHPTTNRSTLGKAVSNGCVGLSEADAWMVYYHAPLGTRVNFRYDLTSEGKVFSNVYGL